MPKHISGKSRKKKLKKRIKQQQAEQPTQQTAPAPSEPEKGETKYTGIRGFYEKNYKKLLLIPFLMLLTAIIIIAAQTIITGDFVHKGVTLKGGTTITFENAPGIEVVELMNTLEGKYPGLDINVRSLSRAGSQVGIIINTDSRERDTTNSIINYVQQRLEPGQRDYSIETMGGSLGESFFRQTVIALLIAFCFMGIVVFLYFKTLVPSAAVILAAASDIIVTVAVVNVLGIKLSTAGIAAFLMLIGYSVDTDILLSTKVLKRKGGKVIDRVFGAMRTGLTMSVTTLAVVTVALFFSQSEIIKQIMTILLFGLVIDLINTWIQNAGILRLYLEKKKTST